VDSVAMPAAAPTPSTRVVVAVLPARVVTTPEVLMLRIRLPSCT
jgi:hypothetical protein